MMAARPACVSLVSDLSIWHEAALGRGSRTLRVGDYFVHFGAPTAQIITTVNRPLKLFLEAFSPRLEVF
jgi:hypothetical protein